MGFSSLFPWVWGGVTENGRLCSAYIPPLDGAVSLPTLSAWFPRPGTCCPPSPTSTHSALDCSNLREGKEREAVSQCSLSRSPGKHPADKLTRNIGGKTKKLRAPADQNRTSPRDVLHAEYGELVVFSLFFRPPVHVRAPWPIYCDRCWKKKKPSADHTWRNWRGAF